MLKYVIIIEKALDGGYGAYVPDLPGCIGMGEDYNAALENAIEAIKFHIDGLKEEGLDIPKPKTMTETLILT